MCILVLHHDKISLVLNSAHICQTLRIECPVLLICILYYWYNSGLPHQCSISSNHQLNPTTGWGSFYGSVLVSGFLSLSAGIVLDCWIAITCLFLVHPFERCWLVLLKGTRYCTVLPHHALVKIRFPTVIHLSFHWMYWCGIRVLEV